MTGNQDEGAARTELPRTLRLYLLVAGALTLLCGLTEAICTLLLHRHYPYTWPLMPPDAPFLDFALYQERFARMHSAEFFTFAGPGYYYPAPLAVVHWLFLQLPQPVEVFLACLCAAFAGGVFALARALQRRGLPTAKAAGFVLAGALCCYPFFFEFEQANLEWVLCVLCAGGVFAWLSGRPWLAAVCFGLAASMKLYPAIFLALLFTQRRYRQFAGGLVVAAAATLAGLWLVCPTLSVSWSGTLGGLEGFRQAYILRFEQVGFDHSLFALAKGLWRLHTSTSLPPETLATMLRLYLAAAALAAALYFLRIRHLPAVNQVLCLTIVSILLPPVSYDYTLIHLFVPLALLLVVAVEQRAYPMRGLSVALVLLAILMAPETEFIVRGNSLGGQVKALALVALLGVALHFRFPSRYDERLSPAIA